MKRYILVLSILFFSFNLSFAQDDINESLIMAAKYGKLGYVCEKTGKIVVPFKYDYIDEFYGGMAEVGIGGEYSEEQGYLGGKWGFVDTNGVEVIPVIYEWFDNPRRFDNGKKRVRARLGNKYVLVDKKGNVTVIDDYNEWDKAKLD